jgi:Peptidase family M28
MIMSHGWHRLIPRADRFRGEDRFPIDAYSEFMPPPRVGWKPYGGGRIDSELFSEDDPFGFKISEFQEAIELQPGLLQIAKQVVGKLSRLVDGDPDTGIPRLDLKDNPYWPAELAAEPKLPQERCLLLLPLALSRTQDDKGRVRWTLFGNSEQGPGKVLWKSFFTAPNKARSEDDGLGFFSRLLRVVYRVNTDDLKKAGFRILPDDEPEFDFWDEGQLPSWTSPFILKERASITGVKYLLTFRPFSRLPAAVRQAYLAGKLVLLPFPGSLAFWGAPAYRRLYEEMPLALQVPLLHLTARHRMHTGIRVPQSGFLHEPNADRPHANAHAGHIRNTYKRTHRWDKILRDQDELAIIGREDKLLHVLFSTIPDDLLLYDKPMARNVQLWTEDARLLLDGPNATPDELKEARHTVQAGGMFGYRFLFPAMRVGTHELYWHRPLVAYRDDKGDTAVLPDAPAGYLTAYDTDKFNIKKPVELWPRIQQRPIPTTALGLYTAGNGHVTIPIIRNVRKLFDAFQIRGGKRLSRSFAEQLVTRRHGESLDAWLDSLPNPALAGELREIIEPKATPLPPPVRRNLRVPASLTYDRSARRSFEVDFWKTIAALSEGTMLNKNNADCVRDDVTQRVLCYHGRQLDHVGDYLLAYYERQAKRMRMGGKVLVGEVPFRWRTDFDYSWMGGWLKNQEGAAERDIVVVIPGRDRKRAVVMSDHYDTAYMEDVFQKGHDGCGARVAACGADDNHSATAAMMLAAPIFMELSQAGRLDCDIWLVHLTGEEFPADCLGARALTQRLVEGSLQMNSTSGKKKDLSKVRIQGLYVSDMIAHNNDRERDMFQISPGTGPESLWLAEQAQIASETWNESVPVWNAQPERAGRPRGRRSPHGAAIPEIAPFLSLTGQVRTPVDPRSTLYNTDGQIFSDAGVPVVLFMENYDINRLGYHDTHDTMENIDLEYGAALCAITIEAVARAATTK